MKQLKDKLVLVLGLGETGLSMLRYLSAQGARLRAADSRSAPTSLSEAANFVAAQQIFCGPFTDALFEGVDIIAISPGVPLADPVVAKAVARGMPVVGDIELFAQHLRNQYQVERNAVPTFASTLSQKGQESKRKERPLILAITGANGKTTVTSMVAHMCKMAGRDAVAAGNISPAVLDVMMRRGGDQPDVWVLELSSFQLETTSSLSPDAATVLNVTEDHLDRYDGMDAYAAAKARVLSGCGVQVLNRDDVRSMAMQRKDLKAVSFGLNEAKHDNDYGIQTVGADIWLMRGDQRLMKASELQVSGLHNVANALAALALCDAIGLDRQAAILGLCGFKGLPHRVEKVAEIAGITYYDDSKGTNVGATEAALKGLGQPAVVILGGVGKGQDFSPLKAAVRAHARAVVLIGVDAEVIALALQGAGVEMLRAGNMADAVQQASRKAQRGDAVLLSPACASLDMFRNYEHRAQAFIAAVKELQAEGA